MNKRTLVLLLLSSFVIYQYNSYSFNTLFRKSYKSFRPFKEDIKKCNSLEDQLIKIISEENYKWSITVLNEKGSITSNINGNKVRVPASNQKLLTTAYALDKFGPFYNLKTKVYYNNKGFYEIIGQGDPDLNFANIKELSKSIINHSIKNNISRIYIRLYEEPVSTWWNQSWTFNDRKETYGAPITRLALTSNALEYSVLNPLERFEKLLYTSLSNSGARVSISKRSYSEFNTRKLTYPIYTIESSPLYSLLGLANSESHNFTSEVLLRLSANNWNVSVASKNLLYWIDTFRLPNENIYIDDGSGLSRKNKLTTTFIAHFLYMMNQHKYRDYYISSLSLLGLRGTLKNYEFNDDLHTRFLGKTGTLNGVNSLSGYLFTEEGYKYISIITNGGSNVQLKYASILSQVDSHKDCSN